MRPFFALLVFLSVPLSTYAQTTTVTFEEDWFTTSWSEGGFTFSISNGDIRQYTTHSGVGHWSVRPEDALSVDNAFNLESLWILADVSGSTSTTIAFDQSFGTDAWSEGGYSLSISDGDIRTYAPDTGTGHWSVRPYGDELSLSPSSDVVSLRLWNTVSVTIRGYRNNVEVATKSVGSGFSYETVSLNWSDIDAIRIDYVDPNGFETVFLDNLLLSETPPPPAIRGYNESTLKASTTFSASLSYAQMSFGSDWENLTRIEVSYEDGGTVNIDDMEITAAASMPVELTSFTSTTDGTTVQLAWETASETNNAGFEIEYRAAGDPFVQIGFVSGQGTTAGTHRYTYRATGLEVGNHTFRLKQVDYDGTFEYSPEVEATIMLTEPVRLSAAYPNPFNPQTRFSLSVAKAQHVTVVVYNILGQPVRRLYDGILPANEVRTFVFDAGSLPSGPYIYRVLGTTFAEERQMILVR